MDFTREDEVVHAANMVLASVGLGGRKVSKVTDCNASMFVLVFERMFKTRLEGIIRKPTRLTEEDNTNNAQIVIDTLSTRILEMDISYLKGSEIAKGNFRAIASLVELFRELCAILIKGKVQEVAASTGASDGDSTARSSVLSSYVLSEKSKEGQVDKTRSDLDSSTAGYVRPPQGDQDAPRPSSNEEAGDDTTEPTEESEGGETPDRVWEELDDLAPNEDDDEEPMARWFQERQQRRQVMEGAVAEGHGRPTTAKGTRYGGFDLADTEARTGSQEYNTNKEGAHLPQGWGKTSWARNPYTVKKLPATKKAQEEQREKKVKKAWMDDKEWMEEVHKSMKADNLMSAVPFNITEDTQRLLAKNLKQHRKVKHMENKRDNRPVHDPDARINRQKMRYHQELKEFIADTNRTSKKSTYKSNERLSYKLQVHKEKVEKIQARKFEDDVKRSRLSVQRKKESRENQILRNLFGMALEIEKERLRDGRRAHDDVIKRMQRDQDNRVKSAEQFYRDRISMVTEEIKTQRREQRWAEYSQRSALSYLERELREKRKKDLENLKSKLEHEEEANLHRHFDPQVTSAQLMFKMTQLLAQE